VLIGPRTRTPGEGDRLALNGCPRSRPSAVAPTTGSRMSSCPTGQPDVVHGRACTRAQDAAARGGRLGLARLRQIIEQPTRKASAAGSLFPTLGPCSSNFWRRGSCPAKFEANAERSSSAIYRVHQYKFLHAARASAALEEPAP